MEIEDIMKELPHRYPMLLVDRIEAIDLEARTIVGIKNVTMNEPFFQGHFPGMPVMPGVLQIEAMAQVGGILLARVGDHSGRIPYFMSIDKVKFRKLVKPGDQLRIEATITNLRSKSARFSVVTKVGDDVVSQAELMCMVTDQKVGE
jgi:beta-hydroxyacyl-ACP dehydratase FabZ